MSNVTTAKPARCRRPPLPYWLGAAALLAVLAAGKDCGQGSLTCASVMGNNVEFCHWDRPRLFKQPEIVCKECRKAALGDVVGVACNAIALRNWADSDPIWLQAPLFASREVGLVGQVQYELRRDLFGKVTIVGTSEGADVTFQRLKHRDDPMFRAIEVAACFEATITSMGKDGTPIHYTLTGPSKAIELKEPNLWVGAQGFARLTLRPAKCRLNRGIKEAPPPPRPSTAPPHTAAARPPPPPAREAPGPDLPSNSAGRGNIDTGRAFDSGNVDAGRALHTSVADERRHDDEDDDDAVELVYPDGHVEVVSEQYVQQHFRTAPQSAPGVPAQPPARVVQRPPPQQQLYAQRPVVVNPLYEGDRPPVQYVAAGYGTPVMMAGGGGDPRVVLPMPPVQAGPAGVVPVVYYVTGPDQVLPGNTNEYATDAY